ncbi:oxidoreductase [Actinocorallia populi]|uniref:oxidoreductase n=1 Tax=Actinocorallia populi TaxID=2079200 RepID=UPI0018E4E66B|nr:oxidoreductase [Actinocorallia populi]
MTKWTVNDIPQQNDRTYVVTGANSGLGLETARALAAKGAHVIMACRDLDRGRAAQARIQGGRTEVRRLDLADLESVREFAAAVESVDVLVNNAGIMMPPLRRTAQGFELQFGTNHLGHFALTGLLLDRLSAGDAPRVVTVTSSLHRTGSIRFDDLNAEKSYSPIGHYAQSKFANVLFGLELDRRLRKAGSPVLSLLAHPGYAATNLQSSGPVKLIALLGKPANLLLAQPAAHGAVPQLYAAAGSGAESGRFYGPSGFQEMRGRHPKEVRPVRAATDPDVAGRLWAVSEELTGVRFP